MVLEERYLVIENLSQAQKRKFSEVYYCVNRVTNQQCVLKQVHKTPQNNLAQERLRQEAQFSFDYDGLPLVIDFFEDEQTIQLIKKFEKGVPINEFLLVFSSKKRRIELGEILLKITDLLRYIHMQDILHLDIKPSNILVERNQNNYRVSLIDFGLAMRKNAFENRKTLFPLGFAAPELILNQLAVCNNTTDYFSLGITLWNCLTKKLPLVHPNPSIFTNLQLNHPLPESTLIPSKYYAILEKLSAKYPFEIPANQLTEEEVILRLKRAQKNRYQQLSEFTSDWIELTQQKWWRF
jgi:serine/threonine protein kinase